VLKADQVELAILNLLVDWSNIEGRSFQISQLESLVSTRIGFISEREVPEALILLIENNLIAVEKYGESRFSPYDPNEGAAYFCGAPFRCRALPRARRRQQELAKGNRHGIFISHVSEERPAALRIQQLFGEALSKSLPVFVSSDYKSIESGDPWYAAILEGLRKSQAIVSLLSPTSIDRRWINFEAGIGIGQESRVIPVVWRGLEKGDIGMPLGQLQARDLHQEKDLKALLQSLADICGTTLNEIPISAFLHDLPGLAMGVPSQGLSATLFREDRRVRLEIQNTGTRLVELVEAELLIPRDLRGNNNFREYQPVLQRRHSVAGGVRYVGNCLTTIPSNILHLGINPLRQMLAPGTEYVPESLSVNLPANLSPEDEALSIRFTVSAKQLVFGPISTAISKIPVRNG
jgi:hypothetical protein